MDLELRHLRVVSVVAEQGSVTKAASALGIAQPALTAQLNRIERSLGGALFERDRNGARLTVLGELVLSRARLLLPALASLHDEAQRLMNSPSDQARRVRIGSALTALGGRFVEQVVTGWPDASVTTRPSWSAEEITQLVATGTLDCGVIGTCHAAPPPSASGVVWAGLAVDPLFVLVSETHPLAGRASVRLAELRDEVWVAAPGDGCLEECFAAACARAGFTPRSLYEAEATSCVDLVASGFGVALCQPTFRDTPGVTVIHVRDEPLTWGHYVGWHEDNALAADGRFVTFGRRAHREAVRSSARYGEWLPDHPEYGALSPHTAV
ncbi:LysR family transcriptional regulator [Haloactinopolyspora alba]|nr:LysR family transcriptional regulator [Haloactinopolyspora alba]